VVQSYVAMAYTLLRERLGPEQLATVMDAALMKQLEVRQAISHRGPVVRARL
jgi:hypothetical protein